MNVFIVSLKEVLILFLDTRRNLPNAYVKISITTGFRYEEINKAFILANYTNCLAKEYNFQLPILIQYKHSYTYPIKSEYYISIGNGWCTVSDDSRSETHKTSRKKALIIRVYAHNISFTETLKVIEFGIKFPDKIKSNQIQYHIDKKYSYWKYDIESYPIDSLNNVIESSLSKIVSKVLSQKVYKPMSNSKNEYPETSGIGYYCKNDSIHIYAMQFEKEDTLLMSIPNIYWFERVNYDRAIIFDTDSTFYYAEWKHNSEAKAHLSKQHIITNRPNKYYPFEITEVKDDKIFISYLIPFKDTLKIDSSQIVTFPVQRNRTTYYDTKDDFLIVDFDKFMKNAR